MPPLPQDSDAEEFSGNGLQEMEDDDGDANLTGDAEPPSEGLQTIDFSDEEEDEMIDIIDESKLVFQKHDSSVFSIDVSKGESSLVVTGGEDDKGFVWNYESNEILFECVGHNDSVICCGFSSDSKYVMTADMGGTVIVFDTSDGKRTWEYECSDIEWCKWHRSAHVLFAGTSNGDVYMWKIPNGDCKIYASHGCRTTCGSIMPNGKEIVVAYEDGSLKKWDLKTVACVFHHKSEPVDPILCLDILSVGQKNGNLVAYGTQSGTVKLLNSHTGKQLINFSIPGNGSDDDAMEEDSGEYIPIESVVFSPCGSFIAGGSINGNLCIWDISTQRLRHECKNPSGLSKLIWNEVDPNYVISSGLDGVVRMWDHKNGELFKEFHGHLGTILDIAVSNDRKYILTAGDDSTARLFEK